ncbi:MAG: DUF3306 domain-containing protein [Sedimenticola sp.]|nr:DUF3306 domain-containing protein [Sedimenticola sp.]
MSDQDSKLAGSDRQGGFVSRWSRLKQASLQQQNEAAAVVVDEGVSEPEVPLLCDEDMPPIESLTEESDYSGFLSEKVSDALRQQALRKLFHSASFNVCDGLDDYAEDFTNFAKLGSIITSDMRHQMAVAKEKLEAAMKQESSDEETPEAQVVSVRETEHQVDEQPPGDVTPRLAEQTAKTSDLNDPQLANQTESEGRVDP